MKNYIVLVVIIVLVLFAFSNQAVAQSKTAYQKRMEQIDKELAQKFGYSEPNNIVALEILNGMTDYYKGINSSRAKIYSWYTKEQEAAKKLKTQADFDREKKEQEEALAKKKAEEAKRAAQAAESAKRQAEEEAAEEAELLYKNSDYYNLNKKIGKQFEKWSKKGEFETTSSYEERLKNQSVEKFYQICEAIITDFFEEYSIDVVCGKYDADNQIFPVTIYVPSKFWEQLHRKNYTIEVPIPIEEASDFKSSTGHFVSSSSYETKWEMCKVYDLAFDGYYIVPTKVKYTKHEYNRFSLMEPFEEHECIVPIENPREVTFAFKDLGIQNSYCQDAVWHISMIKIMEEEKLKQKIREEIEQRKIEQEQRRQDSIACIEYNRQLDSIVTAYNKKLQQDEYNFEKETVSYSPLQLYELKEKNIEYAFNEEQNRINEKYKSIMYTIDLDRKIVEDYKQTNFNDLKNFVFVDCVSPLPSGHNSHTYYYCPEYIYKDILIRRAYKKGSDELIAKLIEVTVEINTQLNDEWTRNGQYFENKVDFFDSYLNCSTGSRTINVNPQYEDILYGKMPESERQRYDSIVCIEYNHKLDSIITAYNKELLQNEYNFGKKTVDARNLECGQGIGKRFRDAKKDVDNKFNFIKDAAEKAKQRIQDSIVCAGYNKQLDSIVVEYNQKLLQEEYNFENRTIENPQLEPGQGIEKRFSDAKSKISNNFNSIMSVVDRNKKVIENYKQTYSGNIKDLTFVMFNSSDWHSHNNCPDYLIDNIVPGSRDRSYSNELVEKLIEYTVDTNTQLSKEWTKNGQYFDNKADFFNSYLKFDHYHKYVGLNPEYKTILKEKKKTKK